MFRKLAILLAVFLPAIALAGGPVNPPGPIPTTCTGGNAVTQYGGYGEVLSCGTPTSTGTINTGSAPAVAQYQGASSVLVGPATISGATANIAVSNALAISTQTIFNAQSGATYTLLAGDNTKIVHLTNAAPVLTLLTAATAGSKYATTILCDNACTINTAGGDTINGGASLALVAGQSTQLVTDGVSVWYALGDGAVASVSGTAGQITVSPTTGAAVVSLPTTITKNLTFSGTNAYGTPTSITLTNGTSLPISTGVSGLGTGVATFLATPSSANLLSALTTKTGTGLAVFGTSPTLSGLTLSDVATGTQCLHANSSGVVSGTGADCGAGGGGAFSSLTGGTNTSAAMVVGTGASLATSGSGTIAATSVPNTAVTAGSYTNTNLTVAADGRITAASNGTGGSGGISTVTDGTHTQTSATTLSLGTGLLTTTGSGGTAPLSLTNAQNSPTDSGTHSYTVLSSDLVKEVILANTFTALSVPQATGSFGAGSSFTNVTKSAITATPTTSTVNGLSSLKIGANQFTTWDSDGTNWLVGLGVPQPADQTGSRLMLSDFTWTSAFTNGQLPCGSTGTDIVPCTITAGTPNISSTQGAGSVTIGTTVQTHDITSAGTAIVTGDNTKIDMVGAHTYTLAQAGTTGFGSGWSVCLLNNGTSGNATINATTSTFNGAGNSTSLVLVPGAWACPTSDGTNYQTTEGGNLVAGSNVTITVGADGRSTIASSGSGGIVVGTTSVTGTCTSGNNLYNNAGVVGCQANGGGSGAVTLVSTQTASSSAALTFTGIGTANHRELKCRALILATASQTIGVQVSEDGGSTWKTSGYAFALQSSSTGQTFTSYSLASGNSVANINTGTAGSALFFVASQTNASPGASVTMNLDDFDSSTAHKSSSMISSWNDGTNLWTTNGSAWYTADNGAVTAIRVIAGSGNITSGTCSLYNYS